MHIYESKLRVDEPAEAVGGDMSRKTIGRSGALKAGEIEDTFAQQ